MVKDLSEIGKETPAQQLDKWLMEKKFFVEGYPQYIKQEDGSFVTRVACVVGEAKEKDDKEKKSK